MKTRAEEAKKQFNIPVTSSPRLQYANPHLTRGVNFKNLVAVSKRKPSCLSQASVHFVPRVMLANTTSNLNPTSPTYQESFYLHLLSEDSLNMQSNATLSLLSEGSLNIQSNTSRLENHFRIDTRVCLQSDNVREDSLRDNVRDRGINYDNLRYINCSNANINAGKSLQFCTWNAQSLRNKTYVLHDYLCHKDIDICAITESWFKTKDTVARAECTPPGYTIKNHSRSGRAGGGIALIYKSTLSLVKVAAGEKTSFQFVEYTISSDLRSGADKIKLLVIYRPPYSTAHRVTVTTFFDEFANYLESIILSPEPLVITGDMNIHVDDPNDSDVIKFLDLLDTHGLTQHVNTPTHRFGHTLDLIITRVSDALTKSTPIADSYLSDHSTVLCSLVLSKPVLTVKQVTFRKIKAIDLANFKNDIAESILCRDPPVELMDLVSSYNTTCASILNKHAPELTKTIIERPRVPWFNEEIRLAKRDRRTKERIWRTSKLDSDRASFLKARNNVSHLIGKARTAYYKDFVSKNSVNQRSLFKAANVLLGAPKLELLPPHSSAVQLANDLGEFFIRKIADIRADLDSLTHLSVSHLPPGKMFTGLQPFTNFTPVTSESVKRLIVEAPTKSCPSDPIPTGLLKECLDELLPVITRTINLSLEEGKFPSEWKGALVKPKLKKADLDLIKENFRPLSNLQFVSKLTEKAVAQQTLSHIVAHDLFPDLQSAYRRNCSTETALLRVRNDILFNMNRRHVTLLVFLDLSAAFDTIDHLTLLDRLRDKFGIDGVVLEWFRSYLTDRSQQVIIGSDRSRPMDVHYGVPQGSCLGPLLFSIYTSQIFDIISDHLPIVHCFTDDTRLYLSFRPDDQASQDVAVAAMEACILQDKLTEL